MTTTKTGDDLLIINLKVYAFKVSLKMYVMQPTSENGSYETFKAYN